MTPIESYPSARLFSAATTPFTATGALDVGALGDHLRWLRDAGVDGVFAGGSTGEFTALSDDERLRVIEEALLVFGPEGVIAHIGGSWSGQAVELASRASAAGARLLSAITPFYQPCDLDGLRDYYGAIVDSAGEATVLGYLFNARTTTVLDSATFAALAADTGLVGAKVSGESVDSVGAYLGALPQGSQVFTGGDADFAACVAIGAAGAVSGVSSALPQPFVSMRDALRSGDAAAVSRAQKRIELAVELTNGAHPAYLKALLEAQGLPGGPVRLALTRPNQDRIAESLAVFESGEGVTAVELGTRE